MRVLTAASMRLDLTDRREARRMRALRQGWQLEAWAYRDSIPELRYAFEFLANCTARMKIFAAGLADGAESDSPVPLVDLEDCPPDIVAACSQAFSELGNGKLALAHLLKVLSTNTSVAGECYLHGATDPQTGSVTWRIRSVDEIIVYDDRYKLREVPMDPQGILGWVDLDPEVNYIARIWREHPRFRVLADSAMRALIDECESLMILRRMIRATGRSRLAGRGLILLPNEASITVPTDDNGDPQSDPFFAALAETAMTSIADEGTAAAVVPIMARMPGEFIDKVRHLDFAAAFDEMSAKTRDELVGVLATGIDLPKEIITGVADLNHWSAWQVDDNTFRHHVEPHVVTCCDSLTSAFLRPYLQSAAGDGLDPQDVANWVERICVWFDPTELVTHPDQTSDAFQLHDRIVISDASLRRTAGFSEADAPDSTEIEERLIKNMRTWPPNLVAEFIHRLDPTLVVPPITVAGTVPGIKPTGVDTGMPASAPVGPAATPPERSTGTAPPAPLDDTPGPPSLTASAQCDRFLALTASYREEERRVLAIRLFARAFGREALVAALAPPEQAENATRVAASILAVAPLDDRMRRLSRRLAQLDSDLRSRLQTAACAAMLRQLEKAGGRLRSKVAKNEDLRRKIAEVPMARVAAALGEPLVSSLGVTPADLMGGSSWDAFREQFYSWTRAAQRQALKIACQIADIPEDTDAATTADAAMSGSLDEAWQLLETALDTIAHDVLYNPDPNATDALSFNPDTVVPMGTIRAALGVAGGNELAPAPTGAAIPIGQPIGQIGTGTTVQDLITATGGAIEGYEWQWNAVQDPFEPHQDLDGTVFGSFTDDSLGNSGDYPDNEYYFPGDHPGCMCDFMPIYAGSSDDGGD